MDARAQDIAEAAKNLDVLRRNEYPGRFLIEGMDQTGTCMIQAYGVGSRSDENRNRKLTPAENGRIFTEAADLSKPMGNPDLIFYNALCENRPLFVVTNGQHTDDIARGYSGRGNLMRTLMQANFEYEGDTNCTSRIAGICLRGIGRKAFFELAIFRKSRWSSACDRVSLGLEYIPNGFGLYIATYSGDGKPLPPFVGDPLLMPLTGDIDEVLATLVSAYNAPNFVSAVVKYIPLDPNQPAYSKIYNKHAEVSGQPT